MRHASAYAKNKRGPVPILGLIGTGKPQVLTKFSVPCISNEHWVEAKTSHDYDMDFQ
jgi:hypothetical protein